MSYGIEFIPFTTKLLVDVNNEPDPMTIKIPLYISNRAYFPVYVKTVSKNSNYTINNAEIGMVEAAFEKYYTLELSRPKPSSVPVTETLDIDFEAYKDENYSELLSRGTLSLDVEIDNYEAWPNSTVFHFDGEQEGWTADGLSDEYSIEPGGQSLYVHTKNDYGVRKDFISYTLNLPGSIGRLVAYLRFKFVNSETESAKAYVESLGITIKEVETGNEHIIAKIVNFAEVPVDAGASYESNWYKFVAEIPPELLGKDIQIIIWLWMRSSYAYIDQYAYLDHVVVATK